MSMILFPLLACILLTAIHGYFGLHVLKRGVIFLDIALAQLASLGAILGVILGVSMGSPAGYAISAAFTIVGAIIFTLTRATSHNKIPQEAIIGIVYVVAAATAIAALSRFPGEASHLQEMMIGNILFVWPPDLIITGGLYAIIGLIHYVFRNIFWGISTGDSIARPAWWDFAFYVTFGLVVTSSVKLAGVLLVFMLLIAPAIAGLLVSHNRRIQLGVSWLFGSISSAIGLLAAVQWDIPPGASIIITCGGGLLVVWSATRLWCR